MGGVKQERRPVESLAALSFTENKHMLTALLLRHLATFQQSEGQMCCDHVAVALACVLTRAPLNTSCESLEHFSPVMN